MEASSGDGNKRQGQQQEQQQQKRLPHQEVDSRDQFPEDLPPPVAAVARDASRSRRREQFGDEHAYVLSELGRAARFTASSDGSRTPARGSGRRGRPVGVTAQSARALREWRGLADALVGWFAARPLGQRALEAAGHTIATAEQAVVWAGAAADRNADLRPLPFAWYFMMPVVMALMVVRIGAALAERYLNVHLPRNKELVTWLETQRHHLEQLQSTAALHIRTQYVNDDDPMHSFLNMWPFNIPYRAAQQLGILPVRLEESSDESSDSTLAPTMEPVTSTSSGSSTVTEAEEHAERSSGERTPSPEAAANETLHSGSDGERQTEEESEKEAPHYDKQEEVEVEKAEEKPEQPPAVPLPEEAVGAAMPVVSPLTLPSTPPERPVLDEAEKGALGVLPPSKGQPQQAPTSEDVVAAERNPRSEPTTTSSTTEPPAVPPPEEEAVGAAMAVVSPLTQPSTPERLALEEAERAALSVLPPPQPAPTSEDLLAAERSPRSKPATTSGTVRKAASKGSKTSFLVNLFATKLG